MRLGVCFFLLGQLADASGRKPTTVLDAVWPHLGEELRAARIGEWVSYRLEGGSTRVSHLRLSAVGEEKDRDGDRAIWVEIELAHHPSFVAPLAQLRILVKESAGLSAEGMTRLFVAAGAEHPVEVSPDVLRWSARRAARPVGGYAKDASVRILVGKGRCLVTPAGPITASPTDLFVEGQLMKRLWTSPSVPLLGLARIEMPGIDHAMEVTGFGTDATSRMRLPPPARPLVPLARQESWLGPSREELP